MSERARGRAAPTRVLLVACFGAFLAFLDATIVNVAFPSIRESFPEASIGALSWVLNAYNIVFAAFLVVCGRLTDLIGRKRAYAGGITLFTLASVWCAAAGNLELLVAGRVLQALGAAMLVPASLAIVVEAFSSDRRAHAIGLWGATAAVAAGLGPPMGGALVELGGWRWAFLVNLPFGVLAVVATRRTVVESRAPGRRVLPDIPGALLLAAALALLNLGVIQGNDWGWGSPRVVGSFVLAVALGALFVRSSLRHRAPVVDPALVRIASFRVASLATVLAGLGFYAYLLTNILWLQYVWGYDVLRAGLALVPGALVAAVVAARLGPLAERVGYRVLVVPGALVWAGAYLWYHQMVGTAPAFWSQWLPGQVLSGIGVGATLPLLGSAALAAVPGGRYATASALVSSARQLGGVLGISILVLVVGSPTGPGVVAALRDGWLLSICAFVLVALAALPIGKVAAGHHDEDVEHGAPLLLLPDPRDLRAEPTRAGASIGLDDIPLLATLSLDARAALAEASRTVHLRAGEWLFHEGDPPGSAYLVRSGRLEVVQDGRLVRTLVPGAVVGELALLTGEGRSAGVRARRDAALLEVPRGAFEGLLAHDASAARTVLTQLAGQLRTAGTPGPAERAVRPQVIAVVGLHPGSGYAEVARHLSDRLRTHVSVVEPGVVDGEGLARAEADGDRVVLAADGVAPGDAVAWRDFCLRQSDAVVLVARAGSPVPDGVPVVGLQPDLVVIGAVDAPTDRAAWVSGTDAWRLTVVTGDLAPGVADIADRFAGRSLGLVLAGGGARAFAHIGVLRELEEAGYPLNRIAAASVGAALATIYALSRDGAELEERAYAEFVARNPFNDWTIPTRALTRGVRMRGSVARVTGDAVLDGLSRQLALVSTDLVSRTRQVHRRGSLLDATVASMRLPVLFAPIPTDDGRLLMDGGVLDNLPVDVLLERDEGPVVAVNISMGGGGGGRPARTGRPRVPALGETLLRTMTIGAGGAVDAAHRAGAVVLTPATLGVGLLEFHQLDRMVRAGREAARALLAAGSLDLGAQSPDGVSLGEPDVEREPVSA
ncbi:DHA2 family efflux MFS transporter permease subunit [Nocardioides islandensis]|uniref:DHA2 family efflux MFS transporter permease subunit n=1 Tax=Nocardioides islandensis TaxID=433663 RepID=UPI002B275039|nr:DHA2 family efflux MFS transporter permease subunit [Nocardioides islandensis]